MSANKGSARHLAISNYLCASAAPDELPRGDTSGSTENQYVLLVEVCVGIDEYGHFLAHIVRR